MASERAKQLAAKQKAERKAAKLRKKNSDNPQDWSRTRQMVEVYKRTREVDPKLDLWVIGSGVLTAVVAATVAILTGAAWWAWVPLALVLGLLVSMLVLTNRAKKGAFSRYAGQPGSAEVALSMLNKKKYSYDLGVAATRQMDMVHRVVGPCGIVLVGEGQANGARQLLNQEARKHQQVAYGVPVTTLMIGDGDKQVKLSELQKHIEKMPKVMDAVKLNEVQSRLRALDAVRPKAPVPRGPLPSPKGVNRAMRGR
ncbi:DUF4191 domain-containing protein [Nigerium massiliense]|uniref:DUF4191 domain-containing protein n=1 Tax=Nigerium massiliense TaxID=1522317 RepID=UPI000590E155|nr:DUF4191 domain-containing protein [Nigerium massiliense]